MDATPPVRTPTTRTHSKMAPTSGKIEETFEFDGDTRLDDSRLTERLGREIYVTCVIGWQYAHSNEFTRT